MMNEDNSRIARNTIFLYIRQFVVLAISLYTSRVVLNTLGATDYGIYNVVGGVIALFGFVTSALSNASSRYISYAIGQNNPSEVKRTFGSFLALYFCIALFLLVVGETVGLWFVYNYLSIPSERFTAALWVYHFSIISAVCNLIYIPYSSLIVAHERMSAFAYISILDAGIKLTIALLLAFSPIDKLVFYAALILFGQFIIWSVYIIYSKKHFPESSAKFVFDKGLLKEIFSYSGWILFSSLSYTTYTQGLNVLINIFFGPIVNAARGISVQIQTATQNFIIGFQTAMYPQIIKTYAKKDFSRMYKLLHTVCKGSFFLFFILSIPFLFKTSVILELWLKNVPDYTVPFTCCILVFSMLRSITNEINHAVQATGVIKKFQVVDGLMGLAVLPISYIAIRFFHSDPISVFIILVVVELATVVVRIIIGIPHIGDTISAFVKDVITPIILVSLVGISVPLIVSAFTENNVFGFLMVCFTDVLWTIPSIFLLGLNKQERGFLIDKIKIFKNKFVKR